MGVETWRRQLSPKYLHGKETAYIIIIVIIISEVSSSSEENTIQVIAPPTWPRASSRKHF